MATDTASAASTAPVAPVQSQPAESATTIAASRSASVFEAITTVLANADHGPELCLDGALDSAPPICGDTPVLGWDWSQVPGAATVGSVTWVESILVTGTFDGTSFTETVPARRPTAADRARLQPKPVDFSAPCVEPSEGWAAQAARFAANSAGYFDNGPALSAVIDYLKSQPDWSGFWIHHLDDSSDPMKANDGRYQVLVARFTGHLDAHETAIRALWPGAVCVAQGTHTMADLTRIADQVNADEQDGTLTGLRGNAFVDPVEETVDVAAVVLTPDVQHTLDQIFGTGLVTVRPELRQTDEPG